MRLLITTDTVGGVWTYTKELVAELISRDIAIALVIIGRAPSSGQVQWLKDIASAYGTAFHWEVFEAPLEWMSNNERAYSDAESRLCRLARDFGAELLHSNQFCFGALPIDLPKLVVAHSDVLSWADACRDTAIESSGWLSTYTALCTAGLRNADSVVAPTRWMLEALAANFPVPPDSRVIPNGRTVAPVEIDLERKLQVVTAGRLWDEAKNILLLTEVQSALPILVAGEAEYGAQAAPEIDSRITLLGRLDEAALLHLFRQSAIYVCASRYEPFGLAPLEAGLCGCAVLANDIPSLREVWGDGAVYFTDAFTLSAQLAQLSHHPDQLARAQARSFERASRYTAVAMADEYVALYQAMLTPLKMVSHVA